jgi:segregation and condensation protein B
MENIRNIIESLLFVADEPLSVAKLKNVLETVDTKEIKTALHSLADQYEARGGGFGLSEVAGGWQLRSRPEYHEWIKRFLQPSPQRLSKAALETLAIVAYNQPIIRADIEHIRGVDCGGILRQLLERKLIRVLGRKEIPGRPLIYATSKLFLELFDLKDLKDLPTPKEIEEMGVTDSSASDQAVDSDPMSLLNSDIGKKHDEGDGFVDDSAWFDIDKPSVGEQRRSVGGATSGIIVQGPRQQHRHMPRSSIVTAPHRLPDTRASINTTLPAMSAVPIKAPS